MLRQAIKDGLDTLERQSKGGAEALLKIAKLAKKYKAQGPKDLSTNLDKYLWESYEP